MGIGKDMVEGRYPSLKWRLWRGVEISGGLTAEMVGEGRREPKEWSDAAPSFVGIGGQRHMCQSESQLPRTEPQRLAVD